MQGSEVPATEVVIPQERLHVGVSEVMGSDKLAQQTRGMSFTSLLRLPLQEELGLVTLSLNGTFLTPMELLVVACASIGWCQTVEECSAGLGFAEGPYTQALLIESQLICSFLPFHADFDPRDFRLALLVGAESVNQVPMRVAEAVAQIKNLPNVRMPSECPAEAIEWTTIPCKAGVDQRASFSSMRTIVDQYTPKVIADHTFFKQAFDLLKSWRALWCCGLRTQTISAGCLHVKLPGQSFTPGVAGTELSGPVTWDLSAVVLTVPSGVIAAAHISYVRNEKKK